MLTHEETMSLLARFQQGDEAAGERLIEENLALVRSVVRRYMGRNVEYEDLFQLGCMGLTKAIQHFNPMYGVRFSTYAVPLIAGEMKRFLRDDGPVKVTRTVKELAVRAMSVREKLAEETGGQPGVCEIAAALSVPTEEVAMALSALRQPLSLNEPLGQEDGDTIGDLTPAPGGDEKTIDRILTASLLNTLEEREKKLILLRYFRDWTQMQVAGVLGISQVQVSRLESKILQKLRLLLSEGTGG